MKKTLNYFENNFKEENGYDLSLNYNCDGTGKISLHGKDAGFINSFNSWEDCYIYLRNIIE